jgi:hypothetical protein
MNDAGLRRPIWQEVDQPSRPQVLLIDEGWKLTDTDAVQRREAKRPHVFRDETCSTGGGAPAGSSCSSGRVNSWNTAALLAG